MRALHTKEVEDFSTNHKRKPLDRAVENFPSSSFAMTEDHGKREIGDRLRQAREALGFGMAEFARLHDIDKTKLNHWEKGKHYPDPKFIQALYERHRINADWIYLGIVAGLRHDLAESLRAASRVSSAEGREAPVPAEEIPSKL